MGDVMVESRLVWFVEGKGCRRENLLGLLKRRAD